MSWQDEQDRPWLSGYRLIIALVTMVVVASFLVGGHLEQRKVAQHSAMASLVSQFGERLQRLHGEWVLSNHPTQLWREEKLWVFTPQGWPMAVEQVRGPSEDCGALWQALIGREALDGEPIRVQARLERDGCELQLREWRWLYRWQDGAMKALEEVSR